MAEENVQKLLDMLYEMIDEAKNAPLSNDKCVLNRDEALDLLDEIRAQMPVELKRAQELVRARDEYVEAAKRDVERMMQKAEFEAKSKVSESEVLTAARAKGHDIVTRAEERSREMYRVANDYSEDVLRRTEEAVQMALDEVKQTRVRFRAASNEQMQRRREESQAGRAARGHYVPFARRPHRQARAASARHGLHLSAGVSGVRVRQEAQNEAHHPQAHRLGRGGAERKSPRPQRQAACGGKMLRKQIFHEGERYGTHEPQTTE